MATLIENKNRIVSTFNDIKTSILEKGVYVGNNVSTYANAVSLIGSGGIEDFTVGTTLKTSKTSVIVNSGTKQTMTLDYTFSGNANIIVIMAALTTKYDATIPDTCEIFINDEEVGAMPTKYLSNSRPSKLGITKLNVKSGDYLVANYTVNDVNISSTSAYGNGYWPMIILCSE